MIFNVKSIFYSDFMLLDFDLSTHLVNQTFDPFAQVVELFVKDGLGKI